MRLRPFFGRPFQAGLSPLAFLLTGKGLQKELRQGLNPWRA